MRILLLRRCSDGRNENYKTRNSPYTKFTRALCALRKVGSRGWNFAGDQHRRGIGVGEFCLVGNLRTFVAYECVGWFWTMDAGAGFASLDQRWLDGDFLFSGRAGDQARIFGRRVVELERRGVSHCRSHRWNRAARALLSWREPRRHGRTRMEN